MKRILFGITLLLIPIHSALAEGDALSACLNACTTGTMDCYMGCIKTGGTGASAAPTTNNSDLAAKQAAYDQARADAQKVMDGVNAGKITDPDTVHRATDALTQAKSDLDKAKADAAKAQQDDAVQQFVQYEQQVQQQNSNSGMDSQTMMQLMQTLGQ